MAETVLMSAIPARIGATSDQIRYWVQLLGHRPRREGRVSFVTEDVVDQLATMATLIREGIPPKDAAGKVRSGGETIAQPSPVSLVPVNDPALSSRVEQLEKTILLMADEIRSLRQRRQPTDFERFYASFFQPVPRELTTCKQRYENAPVMIEGPSFS